MRWSGVFIGKIGVFFSIITGIIVDHKKDDAMKCMIFSIVLLLNWSDHTFYNETNGHRPQEMHSQTNISPHFHTPKIVILQKQPLIEAFLTKPIKGHPSFTILYECCDSPFLLGKIGSDCIIGIGKMRYRAKHVQRCLTNLTLHDGVSSRYAVIKSPVPDRLAARRWKGVKDGSSLAFGMHNLQFLCLCF